MAVAGGAKQVSALPRRFKAVLLAVLLLAACEADPDGSSPGPAAEERDANSADRLIFWTGYDDLVAMTDVELDGWKRTGVDGFIIATQQLRGMGGAQDYTGDPGAALGGSNYDSQRRLRDSKIVARAKARGMKMYFSFYAVNFLNPSTPYVDWFNDTQWSEVVIPRVRDFAGAARLLGFDGIAIDQELYPQNGNVSTASWSWSYPGNARNEAGTRAQAKLRGAQLMAAVLQAFPKVELTIYNALLPEGWEALVQKEVNQIEGAYADTLHLDLLDGLTSVEGYEAVRLIDAIFYKSPQARGSDWNIANQYNANRIYSLLSRRLSNWTYASSRLHLSPFAWISSGDTKFEDARSPDYVAEQLLAFQKWGTGGEFANYAPKLRTFDYKSYETGIRAASTPTKIDTEAPTIVVTKHENAGSRLTVTGSARDNLAIRVVRWQIAGARAGTATMTWRPISGDVRGGWVWDMEWSAEIPLQAGENTVTVSVEDIKGLTATTTITVPGT